MKHSSKERERKYF